LVTPTEEPPLEGLTKKGAERKSGVRSLAPHAGPLRGERVRNRVVGMPASRRRDLKIGLVHADGGAGDAGADVGDPEELEEALQACRPRRSCRG
jgi:hypothetical protein